MEKVESFALNHDDVTAPYVRKAKIISVSEKYSDCVVSKFDVRFAQPNCKFIPNDALHTLEHFFATLVREETAELVDISPMGCRTGFYFIFSGDKDVAWVIAQVRRALEKMLKWEKPIPGATRTECGNYLEQDLGSAKLWASRFLAVSDEELADIYRAK